MTIYEIISLGFSATITTVSIIAYLIKRFKNKKTNEILEELQKTSEIFAKVPKYINQAEQIFGAKTGLAKLEFVLSKIQVDCARANINIEEQEMVKKIEEILATPTTNKQNYVPVTVNKSNIGYGQTQIGE